MTSDRCHPDLVRMMDSGVTGGVFPGGVLLVRSRGRTTHLSCHGRCSLEPPGGPVEDRTCFDLASLTKILATAPLVLHAVREGRFALDTPVWRVLGEFTGQGREAITVRMLLDHSSGLAAWRPFHEAVGLAGAPGRAAIRRLLAAEVPEAPPGSRAVYSDLNFMLLDWLLERAHGQSLEALFTERVAGPLGLADLFFVELSRAESARAGRTFAATERCPWRGRVLIGEVHDENAFVMGGASGHAGLFGRVRDVSALADVWLASFLHAGGFFRQDLVREFWRRSGPVGSSRALAFDTPSPGASQAGSRFGPQAVGHLGFTGTSLWIDPDRELIAVLLTNRVHPTRANEAIRQFRPALHDRVAELWG